MRTFWLAAALLGLAVTARASLPTHTDTPKDHPTQILAAEENIDQAVAHIRDGNPDAAASALNATIQSPVFGELPLKAQHRALALAGLLAYDKKDYATALKRLKQAASIQSPDIEDKMNRIVWTYRFNAAYDTGDFRESASSVTYVIQHWPDDLGHINTATLFDIEREITGTDAALERNFLQALFDAHWKGNSEVADTFWHNLSLLWIKQGDTQKALLIARSITSTRTAVSILVDKRFDPLTPTALFDIHQMAATEIANARAAVTASPDKLEAVTMLQQELLDTHHYDEALSVADAVIAKVGDGSGAKTYTDFDDKYIWVLDLRAQSLEDLGRWDDAVAQWQHAARRPENGQMNVSQVINLAGTYASLQRPKEALDTLSDLGEMSPFGRMQYEHVKLKAAVDQGDTSAIETHLDYLRKHRADAITTFQWALIEAGKMDEASDLLVERLASEKWRSDALVQMQDYLTTTESPMGAMDLARWKKIVAESKVQIALAKVGRIEHFDIDPP